MLTFMARHMMRELHLIAVDADDVPDTLIWSDQQWLTEHVCWQITYKSGRRSSLR